MVERILWRSKRGGRGGLVWRRELLLEREVGKEDGGGGLVGSRERVEELAHTESCSSGGGEKGRRSWRVVEERVGDEEWHGGD